MCPVLSPEKALHAAHGSRAHGYEQWLPWFPVAHRTMSTVMDELRSTHGVSMSAGPYARQLQASIST